MLKKPETLLKLCNKWSCFSDHAKTRDAKTTELLWFWQNHTLNLEILLASSQKSPGKLAFIVEVSLIF